MGWSVLNVMKNEKPVLRNPVDEPSEPVTLDLALARENFGSDESLLCEIATVFIEDVPLLVAQFEQACEQHDLATMRRMAHSLKGLCATFGAEPARTYAQRIEQDCASGDGSNITCDRIRTFVRSLEDTIASLRSELRLSA